MNRLLKVLAMCGLVLAVAACSKVPAGNVGIRVNLLGDSKGVDHEVLGPGRYWVGWNQDLFLFPTFTQTYNFTKTGESGNSNGQDESITFQSKEGMSINADVGITYHIDPEKVSVVFQKYRKGVDEISNTFLRNMIRDEFVLQASMLDVETVYGVGKPALIRSVKDAIVARVSPIGIVVEDVFVIGDFRLPQQIIDGINSKITAQQKAQQRENEIQTSKAEAQQAIEKSKGEAQSILLKAQAQADANTIISKSITPELLQLRTLERWDGGLPMVQGAGQGTIPMIQLPQRAQKPANPVNPATNTDNSGN